MLWLPLSARLERSRFGRKAGEPRHGTPLGGCGVFLKTLSLSSLVGVRERASHDPGRAGV